MTTPAQDESSTTVLLVEDDEILCDLLTEVLEAEDFRVLAAPGPREAEQMAACCNDEIQLLVTDVVMPGATGVDLAKRIRATRADIRVLFMSGYPRDLVQQKGVPDPRDRFIWKPFSNAALVAEVRGILDSSEARRGPRVL